MTVMREPIEQCAGEPGIDDDMASFGEDQVAGDDAGVFVEQVLPLVQS
jgi:hypothetical protein